MTEAFLAFKRELAHLFLGIASAFDPDLAHQLLFDKAEADCHKQVLRDIARGDITDKGEIQRAAFSALY